MSRAAGNLASIRARQNGTTGAKVLESLRAGDPTTAGPFRLAGRLGHGAMGVVYLSHRSTRPVAVKVIRPHIAEDEYFRRRFALEVEAIRTVGGFHTAALVDADTDAAQPWVATQYIHAPTLLELIDQHGPVKELGAWWLAAGIADALTHIHSVRLLHRDLKPGNVLVAADGVRLIDFGISRVDSGVGLTTAGAALGTLAYMAPEQAADSRKSVEASDVYSLGATLVHAATGHVPFYAELPVQRAQDVQPDLTGLPPELLDLVSHTLAFDAEDRPTAQSVAEEAMLRLQDFGVPQGSQAYPPLPDAFIDAVRIRQSTPLEAQLAALQTPRVTAATPLKPSTIGMPDVLPPPVPVQEPEPGRWASRWRGQIDDRRRDDYYGG